MPPGMAQGIALLIQAASDTLNRLDESVTPINFAEIVPVDCTLTNIVPHRVRAPQESQRVESKISKTQEPVFDAHCTNICSVTPDIKVGEGVAVMGSSYPETVPVIKAEWSRLEKPFLGCF